MGGTVAPDVDTYLERIEQPAFRAALMSLRAVIRSAAPDADEVISYGQPTFKQHGHLVADAAFKRHLSFFPMSSSIIAEHASALAGFRTSAGTIQFSPETPIPAAIVTAIVQARLRENLASAAARKKRARK